MTPTPPAVPDIWYKAQRVLRTAVAVIVSVATTFAAFVVTANAIAPSLLPELGKILPASWVAWLAAALASLTGVASFITWLMAQPWMNALLTKVGLGSVPKRALVEAHEVEDGRVQVITVVEPDPKAIPPGGTP